MRSYLTALVLGNPLNNVNTMVTPGLKCPPDVAAQTAMANMMPAPYANPICKTPGEGLANSSGRIVGTHLTALSV